MDYRTPQDAATVPPKFEIGEVVDLNTWVGMRYGFTIVDRHITYHPRLGEYTWGLQGT